MNITYDHKTDLLYIRFDSRKQQVRNERVADNIVLDLGKDDRIVGIEILDASRSLKLEGILPINFEIPETV